MVEYFDFSKIYRIGHLVKYDGKVYRFDGFVVSGEGFSSMQEMSLGIPPTSKGWSEVNAKQLSMKNGDRNENL